MSDDEGCPHGHVRGTCTACGDIAYLRGIEAERDAATDRAVKAEARVERLREELLLTLGLISMGIHAQIVRRLEPGDLGGET